MSEKVTILGGHGLGDCILSLQCSHFIRGQERDIYISTRDEVFNPLQYCFKNKFNLQQVSEKFSHENAILDQPTLKEEICPEGEFYYVIPDLLFRNLYSFDYEKYNTHPQTIKSTKLLTDETASEKIIYFGLASSTDGYVYYDIKDLLIRTAELLPEYVIYYPNLGEWAGSELDKITPDGLPSNVHLHESPDFLDSIDCLKKSCYFVGTCNGTSHLAFHFGIPRLILDPQYEKLAWIARWKEDYLESIPNTIAVNLVAKIIETNIFIPQTTLIPRRSVLENFAADWKQNLIFKY